MKKTIVFISLVVGLLLMRVLIMSVISVFDTSESRYAAISQNMALSGDFIVPRYYHNDVWQSFEGKPPLYFQAAGLCRMALPEQWRAFAVRLPALLSAIGLLGLLWWAVRVFRDAESARYAVLFCMTSAVFYMMAGVCMTDMMLAFSICGALFCHALFMQTAQKHYSLAVFALLGVGMMVKGPVALVLFGLPVLVDAAVNKHWDVIQSHAWLSGCAVFLAICLPWYVIMARRDSGFLYYFFVNENFLRFLIHNYGDRYGGGRESFRGVAVVWFVLSTLPWTPFILSAIRMKRMALLREPLTGLMLIGCLCITGFWCLTSRVPLPYLLPAVPFFAAALAMQPRSEWLTRNAVTLALCGAMLTPAIFMVLKDRGKFPKPAYMEAASHVPEKCRIAFYRRVPYSADFYFGNMVSHKGEPPSDAFLFVRERNAGDVVGRRAVFARAGWILYAPHVKAVMP